MQELIKKYDKIGASLKELQDEQEELNRLSGASKVALAAIGTTAEAVARAQKNLAFEIKKTRQAYTS